jgi:cupin 2 domain-containing protein
MTSSPANLLAALPAYLAAEQFDVLLQRPGVRLERIVSTGQATPAGEWLSQAETEWVLLLKGAAGLAFEGESEIALAPGDSLLIPATRRHRVNWTAQGEVTVWLALHLA